MKILPHSPTELQITWDDLTVYTIDYLTLRSLCPCASCVDEFTGQRTLKASTLDAYVKPLSITVVGRYAIKIHWSDQHDTGIYHYSNLYALCQNYQTTTASNEKPLL